MVELTIKETTKALNKIKRKRGRPFAIDAHTRERRDAIVKSLIISGESFPSVTELSKKYDVDTAAINNDLKVIFGGVPKPDAYSAGLKIVKALENAINKTEHILNDPYTDEKYKIQAATSLTKTIEVYTDQLERYGHKEKVADKIDARVIGITVGAEPISPEDKAELESFMQRKK